jgi:hypothetical protein
MKADLIFKKPLVEVAYKIEKSNIYDKKQTKMRRKFQKNICYCQKTL